MKKAATLIHRIVVTLTPALMLSAYAGSAPAQERQAAINPPSHPKTAFESPGLIAEPAAIERAALFSDRHLAGGAATDGFYVRLGRIIPGAGWLAGGPGYRHWYMKDRVFVDASAALSWRGYKTAQARVELSKMVRRRLSAGSEIQWHDFTQVGFFGEGPESRESNRSEYRVRSGAFSGYATVQPAEWVHIGAQIGWLSPSILPRAGTFKRDLPDARAVFPGDIVFTLSDQPAFLHREASITVDTRDFSGHPTRGGVLRAAAARDSDREAGVFSFARYEAEAARFAPLAGGRVVVGLHGWLVASDAGDGQFVPFYLQPSLGGHNTLRAYADYRFHDRHLFVVNAEARVAMMTHVDAAVFVDAGNVAARIGQLNLDKRSYGVGFRFHSRRQTFARLDVAQGGEGWRLLIRRTEPIELARLSRRTASAPFVP